MQFSIGLVGEYPPARLIRLVQLAEELGFHRVWLPDSRFQRDVFVNLTLAAMHTSRIGIGCLVTDPYIRHPALTAVAAASVDELSNGRMTLGLGAGVNGFNELGITRRQPAKAIKEATLLIRSLTAGDKDVTMNGDVVSFHHGQLDFEPIRPIPIMVGGRGPKILAIAGEVGDEILIGSFASPQTVTWALKQVARGADRVGRDLTNVPKMSWLYTAVASDPAQARNAVRYGVAVALNGSPDILSSIGVDVPDAVRELMDANRFKHSRDYLNRIGELLPDALLADFSLSGTSEQVVTQLASIVSAGVTEAGLWIFATEHQTLEEAIVEISESVVPAVKQKLSVQREQISITR